LLTSRCPMSHACACLPFSFFSRPLRLTQRAPPRAASRLPESPVQRAFSAPACKPTRLRAPAASATTVRRAQRRRLACRARLASRVQERPPTASATALRRPAPFVRPAIPTTCLMCVLRCARPVALKRVTSLLWPWRAGREGAAVAARRGCCRCQRCAARSRRAFGLDATHSGELLRWRFGSTQALHGAGG